MGGAAGWASRAVHEHASHTTPAVEPAVHLPAAPVLGDESDEGGEHVRHGPDPRWSGWY